MEIQTVWQTIKSIMNATLFEINKTPITLVRHFRKNQIEIAFPQRDLHIRSSTPVPVRQEEK